MQGKVWAKLHKKTKIVKDFSITIEKSKIERELSEVCKHFDISSPMWSNKNNSEWENYNITRFYKDDFIDDFPYDNLEIVFIADEK